MAVNATALTGTPAADQTVTEGGHRKYHGFAVREIASSAAVAVFNIRSGSASGPIIDTCEVPANGSDWHFFDDGIQSPTGIYFDIVSGELAGVVYWS